MHCPLPLLLLASGLLACKAPPQAPTELAELCGYLFDEAGRPDDEEAALVAGLTNLDLWLQEDIGATAEGYTVDKLEQDFVAALDIGNPSTDALIGAAVAVPQVHSVDGIAIATAWADQEEVLAGNYDLYERTYYGDKDCFAHHECSRLEASSYSESTWAIIAHVDSTNWIQFRWVDMPDGPWLVHRSWLIEPADISLDGVELIAQYLLAVTMPAPWSGVGSVRMMTTWIDADYGVLPVPEDFARQQIVKSMQDQGTMIDEWLAAELQEQGSLDAILESGG